MVQFAPSHWPSGGRQIAYAVDLMLTGLVIIKSTHIATFGRFIGNGKFQINLTYLGFGNNSTLYTVYFNEVYEINL